MIGPYVDVRGAGGGGKYSPNDVYGNVNIDPSGTQEQITNGWRNQLSKYLPFNLAAFLTVAGPRTYFSQAVWYSAHQGYYPCPEAPDTCMAPQPWYPMLSRPLGNPKDKRVQIGDYKWRREFEHATVLLDLKDPLGEGTNIIWHSIV